MSSVETIIWYVLDSKGNQVGTVVNNDKAKAMQDALNIYGVQNVHGIEDSGARKQKCCDKCADTPCGSAEGQS